MFTEDHYISIASVFCSSAPCVSLWYVYIRSCQYCCCASRFWSLQVPWSLERTLHCLMYLYYSTLILWMSNLSSIHVVVTAVW